MYKLFKKSKGIKLGSRMSGVPHIEKGELGTETASKSSYNWELAELYFAVPKDSDITKDII
jgi:hypothetical protein